MENEVKIYEAAVKAFEDYCHERKLGYLLHMDSYPLTVSVYQGREEMYGQLSMEKETQPRRPIPSCSWVFMEGKPKLQTPDGWTMDVKTMNRLQNLAQKIVIAFLHQFFARVMLGDLEGEF